jgi:hypothetical protein
MALASLTKALIDQSGLHWQKRLQHFPVRLLLPRFRRNHKALQGSPYRLVGEIPRVHWLNGMVNVSPLDRKRAAKAPSLGEMYDLLRDYVKQETLDPIRGAGRWMAWAALGAVALILGVTFLMVGLLRLVQSELFTASDGKTWIPYLIVVVVSVALVLSSKARIRKPSLHRKSRSV